jgi:hypothetical protein
MLLVVRAAGRLVSADGLGQRRQLALPVRQRRRAPVRRDVVDPAQVDVEVEVRRRQHAAQRAVVPAFRDALEQLENGAQRRHLGERRADAGGRVHADVAQRVVRAAHVLPAVARDDRDLVRLDVA